MMTLMAFFLRGLKQRLQLEILRKRIKFKAHAWTPFLK